MFCLLSQCVVKKSFDRSSSGTDKYNSRWQNYEMWKLSGPFTKRALAEKAAAAMLGNHTTLSCEVLQLEDLQIILDKGSTVRDNLANPIREFLTRTNLLVKV